MPKAPMDQDELLKTRNRILEAAVEIIAEDGFKNLSMRKIGGRMGVSATTIYYYYANKDELNIAIRRRAGELLYGELEEAYESGGDLLERAWLMVEAYLRFGLREPDYYAILFDSSAPKHSDYLGTGLEEAAKEELKSSMRSMELVKRSMGEFAAAGYELPADLGTVGMAFFSIMHGLVSLHNNHLLKEIGYPGEEDVIRTARLFFDYTVSLYGPGAGRSEGEARRDA